MFGVRALVVLAGLLIAGCSTQPAPTPVAIYTQPPIAQTAPTAPVQDYQASSLAPIEAEPPPALSGEVATQGASASSATPLAPTVVTTPSYGGGCAENGSCYGDISDITFRPKTTYVSGYYRKDGTYVRSHYRSKKF